VDLSGVLVVSIVGLGDGDGVVDQIGLVGLLVPCLDDESGIQPGVVDAVNDRCQLVEHVGFGSAITEDRTSALITIDSVPFPSTGGGPSA
jgi:hypothetical protein